ncbi:MAG: histidine kinase [Clostridia bacterium]|nr:histidine kinase [Clostridia bacterium]
MTMKKGFLFQVENQRFNNLFFRNFFTSILISLLLTTLFGGYIYYTDSREFREKIHDRREESLLYVKNVIDDTILSMDKIAINTRMQPNVEKFILSGDTDKETLSDIRGYIKNYTAIYRYIDSFYIYTEQTKEVFDSSNERLNTLPMEEFSNQRWYEAYLNMDCNSVRIFEHQESRNEPYLITIVRPFSANRKDKLGAVVINLNALDLAKLLKHDNTKQNLFLLAGDGHIILSRDALLVFKNVNDDENYKNLLQPEETKMKSAKIKGENAYITIVNSAYNDWKYVIYDFQNEYKMEWTSFFWQLMEVCFIFFAVSLFVTYMLTMRNYKPLKNIMTFIDKTNDEPEEAAHQKGNQYANKLASIILNSNGKNDEEIIHQFIGYNKAQIMALHSQIKAHFLYNMLSTIQWRAFEMTETENDVSVMIYKLGEFLKTSMEINASIVSVEEELVNARLYVELMQLRYEDVFCVNWNVDEAVHDYKTINICLQPIIENAIEHGLRHKKEKGMLTVIAKRNKGFIQFVVEDDGVGMTQEKEAELNQMLAQDGEYSSEHVGLMNVSKRLSFMFGNKSSIRIESTEGEGTKVVIRFPEMM